MSAWYTLSGEARLRRCPQVEAILGGLRDLKGDEFAVATRGAGPGAIELTFRGGSEFTDEGADELDAMLGALARFATEPAVFTGEYDGELRVVALDPADWSDPAPCSIPVLGIVR